MLSDTVEATEPKVIEHFHLLMMKTEIKYALKRYVNKSVWDATEDEIKGALVSWLRENAMCGYIPTVDHLRKGYLHLCYLIDLADPEPPKTESNQCTNPLTPEPSLEQKEN
jgi:hypothetical protein